MDIRGELFSNQDSEYRNFHKRLVPDIDENKIIGVRLPIIRKIAKECAKNNTYIEPYYYEEYMIKGLMIGYKKLSCDEYIKELNAFVPLIDNWAVCDSCCSSYKFVNKYKAEMFDYITNYLKSNKEFELRFAIVMLMDYYLTDDYISKSVEIIKSIKSDYYYVNMAIAWALSNAYIKDKEIVLTILERGELSPWIHNKTISKICDSYRVSKEDKVYLKRIRR